MNVSPTLRRSLRITVAVSAALAMLLQCIAYLASLQVGSNYFEYRALLPILASVSAIIAATVGTLDAILTGKQSIKPKDRVRLASLPAAIGFAIAGVHLLLIAPTRLGIISAILLIFGALYCALDCIGTNKFGALAPLIGFAAVLGCACLTGYHYFDNTVEMNAPVKVSLQLALLVAMLFYTGELRCRLGIAAPRTYQMLNAWMLASGSLASLPIVFAYLAGKITRADHLTAAILVLGITATAGIRFASLLFADRAHETVYYKEGNE